MARKYVNLSILFLCAFLLFACKKDSNRPGNDNGTVTAPGVPDASTTVKKTIGVAGGMLQSKDGRCSITIPPGALEADIEFSLQNISNTNPLGLQGGFRILPHITNLKKKASIRFSYSQKTAAATSFRAIKPSYQNENGIWTAVGGAELDSVAKTVTISTHHFSDWTLFSHFFLMPQGAMVEPDNNLDLEVFVDTDFLEPLEPGEERPINGQANSARPYVKNWTLNGEGLLEKSQEKARYKAPSESGSDEATVVAHLDLGDKGQYLLLSHINLDRSGILLIKDGGAEKWIKAYAMQMEGIWVINGGNDDATDKIRLSWEGSVGYHSFASSTTNSFMYIPNPEEIYLSSYTKDNEAFPSGGGITITHLELLDDYIEGNFDVNPTGKFQQTSVPPHGDASGIFRVKKREIINPRIPAVTNP